MSRGKRWLTTRELAEELGLSPTTVRRLLEEGRIKGVRLGHWWRIPREELDRILRDGLQEEFREGLAAPDELEAGKEGGA